MIGTILFSHWEKLFSLPEKMFFPAEKIPLSALVKSFLNKGENFRKKATGFSLGILLLFSFME